MRQLYRHYTHAQYLAVLRHSRCRCCHAPPPSAVLLRRLVVTAVEPEVAAGAVDIVNVEVVVDDTVTLLAAMVEIPRSDKRTTESSRSM